MGWRQGRGLGTRGEDDSAVGAKGSKRGWGKVAGVGVENTPIHQLPPKNDAHGLGFDPFKVRPTRLARRSVDRHRHRRRHARKRTRTR